MPEESSGKRRTLIRQRSGEAGAVRGRSREEPGPGEAGAKRGGSRYSGQRKRIVRQRGQGV